MRFFPGSAYLFAKGHYVYENIFILSCQFIIAVLFVGIMFFATVWCLYFLSRIRELSRKIHYLKKQTEERCYEELTNAKVDYIKSIFIAAICFFEIVKFVNFIILVVSIHIDKNDTSAPNCTNIKFILGSSYNSYFIRGLMAMEVSSILLYTSLIHILTSYLCHAYAEKRIITLTRRDKVLISYLLIQLVVMWISIVYWRVFLIIVPIMILTLFPIHLCLYVKYSRRLYMLLKRRRLDAWFEDPDSYKKLVGMCKEYKTGSILYTVSIVLIAMTFFGIIILKFTDLLFRKHSQLDCIFHTDLLFLVQTYREYNLIYKTFKTIILVSYNIFAVLATFSFFLLHVLIAYGVVRKLVKRRRDYRRYTGTRSVIYQPLIGRK